MVRMIHVCCGSRGDATSVHEPDPLHPEEHLEVDE